MVIDTSGAYIPGHGTPTVIIVGRQPASRRRRQCVPCSAFAVNPDDPTSPAKGLVWTSIVEHID